MLFRYKYICDEILKKREGLGEIGRMVTFVMGRGGYVIEGRFWVFRCTG